MVTKKDFEFIAASIKRSSPMSIFNESDRKLMGNDWFPRLDQWRMDINNLSYALKAINPRFDRDKFLEACGYNEEEAK